jgi:hypothetical protein
MLERKPLNLIKDDDSNGEKKPLNLITDIDASSETVDAKKKYTYHSISSSIRGFCSRAYKAIRSWWGNTRTAIMGRSEFKIDIAFGFFYFRAWSFYIGWVRK